LCDNSDRIIDTDHLSTQAFNICNADAKFFKCEIIPELKRMTQISKL